MSGWAWFGVGVGVVFLVLLALMLWGACVTGARDDEMMEAVHAELRRRDEAAAE